MTTIGRAITVKGVIQAEEPVCIAGTVTGDVFAANHDVTVERGARVQGAVMGRRITVRGTSTGRLIAREVVRVHQSAIVRGDIAAPKLALEEGALFTGSVEPARADAAILVAEYRERNGTNSQGNRKR